MLQNIYPPENDSQANRDFFAYSIAKPDDRIIIYELKRPRILPVFCPCCTFAQEAAVPISTTNKTTKELEIMKTTSVIPEFEYLKLPEDLQTQFEEMDPEMHQRINRHLQHRNGLVVEYNPGMSAILGCNTDFTFLGSESAARCAACYVLKYITKNPSELASTVALVYKARIAVKNHPSKAEDSGSNIRTAIHFLNSILNRINGLEEVSAQMAAAAVIGMSFDTVTHDFQLTFVTAAMAYAKREIEERNKKTPLTLLDEFGTVDADEDIMEWEEDVNEETDGTEFNDENSPNISCTPDAEFEPFQSENAKEREAWGENEGYCTSSIYTGLTGRIACPQHIHYVHRDNNFLDYSLYEYAGLVKVLPKSPSIIKKERKKKEDTQQTSEDPVLRQAKTKEETVTNHRGRASNGSFLFNVKHPLFTTHVQQIRSKHFIPIPIGIPPCPPGKRRSTMTDAWMQQARKFARYILILFRPWNEDGGRLPGPLTWKALCEFLRDLRNGPDGKGLTILDRVRLAWISNMSRGLRMTTIKRVAASRYRMRSATVLGKPDGISAILKPIDEDRNDASFAYDDQSKDESDRSNDRKFDPNDPNTAIEMLRSEAAADDLLQRENEKELAFHEATLKNLDIVMGHDAAQTPQSPLSQSTVQRLLYTSAPPNTSFEKIIAELSSPVPPKQIDSNDHQLDPMCSKKRDFHFIDPKNATLESMNDGQKASYKLIGDYLIAEANSRKGLGPKPLPPRLFIDGGPGTGKTYLINCIKQNAENVGLSVMTCAYTGSAVDNLPKGARTIHNLFGFRVADPNAETDYQLGPKQKKLVDLRKNINLSTVCMLIIDEISYVSSKFFGRIEKRMTEIMAQKNLPFGGLAVVIVGDMFQFSPVEGTALYTSTVDLFLRNKQMDPATTSGVQYFVTFRKISLEQQMRVTDDPKHMAIIKKLRTVYPPMTDILQEIERDYQILTRDLILSNPLFSWSPIVVTSNNERNSINNKESKMFALKHNTRRFSWQETIFGSNITKIEAKQQEINLLYLNDKSLTRYFVEGAPVSSLKILNRNEV